MALPKKFTPARPTITVTAAPIPPDRLILTSVKPVPVGWLYSAGRLCAAISSYTVEPGVVVFTTIPDSIHPVLRFTQLSHAVLSFLDFRESTLYRVQTGAFVADGRMTVIRPPLIVTEGEFHPLRIPTGTTVPQPRS